MSIDRELRDAVWEFAEARGAPATRMYLSPEAYKELMREGDYDLRAGDGKMFDKVMFDGLEVFRVVESRHPRVVLT